VGRFSTTKQVLRIDTPWVARTVRRLHADLDKIEAQFVPTVPACRMVDGLYIRANGRLPCWCGPGEARVHGLSDTKDPLRLPGILAVRKAFSEGKLPFPDICENCQARRPVPRSRLSGRIRVLDELHIEPSFLCGLGCSMCPQDNKARRESAEPPYHMPLADLDTLLDSLKTSGVRHVRTIRLEGKGEPLLHPEIETMIKTLRKTWPATTIVATTSGSLPIKPALATSGLDLLTFSVDGFSQDIYEQYRVRGRMQRVLAFISSLRKEIGRTGSRLQLVWKYILFSWNDDPEELLAAGRFCAENKLAFELRFTHSDNGSTRWTPQSLTEWAAKALPHATVKSTLSRTREDAEASGDKKRLSALGIGEAGL
jgi:molybdenum cofactor biosynthesis enzyme MoaA